MNYELILRHYYSRITKYHEIDSDALSSEILHIFRVALSDSETLKLIQCDYARKNELSSFPSNITFIQYLKIDPAFEAVLLYRVCHYWYMLHGDSYALRIIATFARATSSCEIYYSSKIESGFCIFHGNGVVIGPNHNIGKNFSIYQGVTLGQLKPNLQTRMRIGKAVTVFSNSVIIGSIDICDNVIIGANSLVNRTINVSGVWLGSPARLTKTY